MINWRDVLQQESIKQYFENVTVGIERESHRVKKDGNLSESKYPAAFGDRHVHPMIKIDFTESQLELITPITQSNSEVLDYLGALYDVVLQNLPDGETIWPFSMPPDLPEKEEDIHVQFEDPVEIMYTRYLNKMYGKKMRMISGIHYNIGFSNDLFREVLKYQQDIHSFQEIKNEAYVTIIQNYLHYRWLLVYLFGASPYAEAGFFSSENQIMSPVRSIRNSRLGFTNFDQKQASYESIEEHIKDLERMLEKGVLIRESEYYAPVRFRGGATLQDLKEKGIQYIELRNFDIDPLSWLGVSEFQLRFVQLFLFFMLWKGKTKEDLSEWINQGNDWNHQVAMENPLEKTSLFYEGVELLSEMAEMARLLSFPESDQKLINEMMDWLYHPEKTYSGKLVTCLEENQITHHELGVYLSRHYGSQRATMKDLYGFNDLSSSTQLIIKEALKRGIVVSVLDADEEILLLQSGGKTEFIAKGTICRENKDIVNRILSNPKVLQTIIEPYREKLNAYTFDRELIGKDLHYLVINGEIVSILESNPNEDGLNNQKDTLRSVASFSEQSNQIIKELFNALGITTGEMGVSIQEDQVEVSHITQTIDLYKHNFFNTTSQETVVGHFLKFLFPEVTSD